MLGSVSPPHVLEGNCGGFAQGLSVRACHRQLEDAATPALAEGHRVVIAYAEHVAAVHFSCHPSGTWNWRKDERTDGRIISCTPDPKNGRVPPPHPNFVQPINKKRSSLCNCATGPRGCRVMS